MSEGREENLQVKVLATCYESNSQDSRGQSILREFVVPGVVIEAALDCHEGELHNSDSDLNGGNSLTNSRRNSFDGNDFDNLPATLALPEANLKTVGLEINFAANNISIEALLTIRFQVSLNRGADFCPLSLESSTLICHAFAPAQCIPIFYPIPISFLDHQVPTDGGHGIEIHVAGQSFLPASVMSCRIELIYV